MATPKKTKPKPTAINWQLASPIHWIGYHPEGWTYHVNRGQDTAGNVTWVSSVQLSDNGATLTFEEAQTIAQEDADNAG